MTDKEKAVIQTIVDVWYPSYNKIDNSVSYTEIYDVLTQLGIKLNKNYKKDTSAIQKLKDERENRVKGYNWIIQQTGVNQNYVRFNGYNNPSMVFICWEYQTDEAYFEKKLEPIKDKITKIDAIGCIKARYIVTTPFGEVEYIYEEDGGYETPIN